MNATPSVVWSRVRLELARGPDFPEGSSRHGYGLVLPLDQDGRIDEATVRKAPEVCTLHRFWEGEGDAVGRVAHRGPRRWVFAYHADRSDDEPVLHLAEHIFRVGQYLGVREATGKEHTLRIVSVAPAPGLAPPEPTVASDRA